MFGRFDRESREVLLLAEDLGRALGRDAVGPDLLLLALLAHDKAGVFASAGLRFDDLRSLLGGASGQSPRRQPTVTSTLPLRIRGILTTAFRASVSRGDTEVDPWHLALALVEELPGEVAVALTRLEVSPDAVRRAVRAHLGDVDEATAQVVTLPRPVEDDPLVEQRVARFSAAP